MIGIQRIACKISVVSEIQAARCCFRLAIVVVWRWSLDRFDCRWIISLNKNLRSEYQVCKTTLTLLVNAKYLTGINCTGQFTFFGQEWIMYLTISSALKVNQRIKYYLKLLVVHNHQIKCYLEVLEGGNHQTLHFHFGSGRLGKQCQLPPPEQRQTPKWKWNSWALTSEKNCHHWLFLAITLLPSILWVG